MTSSAGDRRRPIELVVGVVYRGDAVTQGVGAIGIRGYYTEVNSTGGNSTGGNSIHHSHPRRQLDGEW